jgi:hypothetical protein
VITCQKQAQESIKQIAFGYSEKELLVAMKDYLYSRKNEAETYEIMNHLLVTTIPTGTIFKVSQIIETIKNIATFNDGRWQLNLA